MTTHLSEEQLLALLHGALAGDERQEAKRHLAECAACAEALARDAALDEILWEARPGARAPARPAPVPARGRPRRRRSPAVAWLAAATAGVAAAGALGYAGIASAGSAATRSHMGDVLAWQNLIFYIPLAVGLLLALGAVFGGHGHDAGHDHDLGHDAGHGGHDHGHDGSNGHDQPLLGKALSLLGVGRVPLTVVLTIAALFFGGIGIVLNAMLASLGSPPWIYGPISAAAALVGMVALTGSAAKLLDRLMPTNETYLVTRHDFAGCTGTLLLPADTSTGYAQVKDREGNVHNIKCRTIRGALAKGDEILIVEYDEDTKTYVVDANPVEGKQGV